MPHNEEVVGSNPAWCWAFLSAISSHQCVLISGPSKRCNPTDFPTKKTQLFFAIPFKFATGQFLRRLKSFGKKILSPPPGMKTRFKFLQHDKLSDDAEELSDTASSQKFFYVPIKKCHFKNAGLSDVRVGRSRVRVPLPNEDFSQFNIIHFKMT